MTRTTNRRPITVADLPPAQPTPPPPAVDGLPAPLAAEPPATPAHPLDAAALPQGKPARLTSPRTPTPRTGLTVEESDGSPSIADVTTIRTSGITVSSPAAGVALLTGGGGSLTVEESGGTPSVSSVTTIRTSGITVSEPSAGVALLTAAGGFPVFVGASANAVIGRTTTTSTLRLEWTTTGGGGRMAYDPYNCFATYTISGQQLTIFEAKTAGVYYIEMHVDIGVTGTGIGNRFRWIYPRLELYCSAWSGALAMGGPEIPPANVEGGGGDIEYGLGNYVPVRVHAIAPLQIDDQVYGQVLCSGSPATGTDALEFFTGWGSFTVMKIGEIPPE